jgi:hypothetical protein
MKILKRNYGRLKQAVLLGGSLLILGPMFGCASTAGPFITNISSDGDDGLVIEKCMARFDPWMSTVSNTQCTQTPIKLRVSRRVVAE